MSSSQTICCESSNASLRRPVGTGGGGGGALSTSKSPRQIIFGWDRFNTSVFLIVIVLFAIWSVTYFSAYKPADDHDGESHKGMEHGHGHQHPVEHHHHL